MRTRLLACLAGGCLGVTVAVPIGNTFGVSPTVALIACSMLGLGLGYVVSMFFDIFAVSAEDESVESSAEPHQPIRSSVTSRAGRAD